VYKGGFICSISTLSFFFWKRRAEMPGGTATAATTAAAPWAAGMQVTLVRLTTRPHLNGATATVKRYLQSRDQWAVVLPNGDVVSVPEENMLTREMLAQLQYIKYGYPLMHQPTFADYVVEKHGKDGRYFEASTDIRMGTFTIFSVCERVS
jgi:hypothetical protein